MEEGQISAAFEYITKTLHTRYNVTETSFGKSNQKVSMTKKMLLLTSIVGREDILMGLGQQPR